MAKGLDKQKNDKKKGKTLKEKRAAKKEKKKQFFHIFHKIKYQVFLQAPLFNAKTMRTPNNIIAIADE